ncbi:MAG: phosphate-starvation-inducible PsiE family protein, partial [Acidobacteria bacterium]|nr:phosphate-starvation-inducible PsiE family protein [Acidobacteriota bacterium]
MEVVIVATLVIILAAILLLSTADVAFSISREVWRSPTFLIESDNLMGLFSSILIVIIGLEMLETIKAYLKEDVVHVELVVLVAIIALGRKVILWDFNKYSFCELIGLSFLMLSLALVFFLIRKAASPGGARQGDDRALQKTTTPLRADDVR